MAQRKIGGCMKLVDFKSSRNSRIFPPSLAYKITWHNVDDDDDDDKDDNNNEFCCFFLLGLLVHFYWLLAHTLLLLFKLTVFFSPLLLKLL